METNDSFDFTRYGYRTQSLCDNTLDHAQLETRCPLDNGRHNCTPISTNQFNRLPPELVIEVLLRLDIPSLTRFRGLSRRSMQLVNSVRQYSAIIEHCPNIIRAIVSIEADAFDCATLYRTLCTTRCYTCNRFGYHLYLIACRRVCYFCFTWRPEYFPLTSHEAQRLFSSKAGQQSNSQSFRKFCKLAKPPSILSLPGRYCTPWGGNVQRRRLRLYDRQAVVQTLVDSGPSESDRTTCEPKRFMTIITAPVLLNGGGQVDHGFFCHGCMDESDDEGNLHFRIKYTAEELPGHIATYGQIVESPDMYDGFVHVKPSWYRPPDS